MARNVPHFAVYRGLLAGRTPLSEQTRSTEGLKMDTETIDQAAVERAYRTLAASISDFNFYRFVSARTSGDDEWLEAA